MRKFTSTVLAMTALLALGACSKPATPPLPGSDRDAHGCIGSAGYSWCEHEGKCVRPWELAAEKGLADDAVTQYCSQSRQPAG